MKVLLVGGGGREHALAWAIRRSPLVTALYAAPGNPGIAQQATCVPIAADALDDLVAFARLEHVDLAVVGPEAPLVAGLADRLAAAGTPVFGPSAAAARIEGSKVFAKDLMRRYRIPTARFATFSDAAAARRYARDLGGLCVVKTDGLAAGKGAIVCTTIEQADEAIADCLERGAFGAAGRTVVVEELLRGDEVSFFVFLSGTEVMPLAAAEDHKTVFDGDQGPNTGGMGAFSPVTGFDAATEAGVMQAIVLPVAEALASEGASYHGVLFVQLMLTAEGPKVIEFNCRFGDPECQALMVRLGEDLVPALVAVARREPLPAALKWSDDAAVCVNLASGGYPGRYPTGLPITGIDEARASGAHVFHAGTAMRDGQLVTAGGRVLSVTATAPSLSAAIARAYEAVGRIRFDGVHYRRDIGRRRERAEAAGGR